MTKFKEHPNLSGSVIVKGKNIYANNKDTS